MSRTRVVLDLETSSLADLRLTGAHLYAYDPSTRVTVLCYAIGAGPVRSWTGGPCPRDLCDAIQSGCVVVSHNYLFELNIWAAVLVPLGFPPIMTGQWSCTMARALVAGLPASLDLCGVALNLPIQKDKSAHGLMLRFARPRSLTPLTWWHESDPARFAQLVAYCARDVETEYLVDQRVPELSPREYEIFLADHEINQRGLRVNLGLVNQMKALAETEKARINARLNVLTNGRVTSAAQVARLVTWLEANQIAVPTLDKGDGTPPRPTLGRGAVEGLILQGNLPGHVEAVLRCRRDASRSSTAKLNTVLASVGVGDRLRGTTQYYGANRTGRWAGRRFQPQNLPRGTIKDIPAAVGLIEHGASAEDLELLFEDSPMGVLASSLRSVIEAAPGKLLVSCDLSQIEARVLVWLAGQDDMVDIFRRGEDVYTYTAGRLGSDNRQLGKVLVLACIAEGELVLTNKGLVPIEQVTVDMRVWDGIEMVSHDGVVCRGFKEIISYDGLRATPDHLVWAEGYRDPVPFGDTASALDRLVRSGSGGIPLRVLGSNGPDIPTGQELYPGNVSMHGLWDRKNGGLAQPVSGAHQELRVPVWRGDEPLYGRLDASRGTSHDRCDATLPEPSRPALRGLWGPRDHVRFSVGSRGDGLDHGKPGRTGARTIPGPDRQRQRLCFGKSSLAETARADVQHPTHENRTARLAQPLRGHNDEETSSTRVDPGGHHGSRQTGGSGEAQGLAGHPGKARVYDILNAGLRHRFTVSGRLVHNCGFGMGPARFQATALNYGVTLSLPEAEAAVMGWRSLNSRVVDYWWALHRAAMRVVRGPTGSRETVGCVAFTRGRDSLDVILPSGRALVYREARIVAHPEHGHPELVYRSVEMGRWSWARSWPGKLTENVVQAIARDVMAEALILARHRKVPLIATVHDELVAEVEEARAPDLKAWLLWAMNRPLSWAPGLPVAAAASIGRRYRKDA